jgi:hypothetical protein
LNTGAAALSDSGVIKATNIMAKVEVLNIEEVSSD